MGLAENDDIALLFLDEPIFVDEPAVLPTAEEASAIVEGAVVDIVGWGQQTSDQTLPWERSGSRSPDRVRSSRSLLMSSRWVSSRAMCASATETGPTYIDVGGSNGTRVIGVTLMRTT